MMAPGARIEVVGMDISYGMREHIASTIKKDTVQRVPASVGIVTTRARFQGTFSREEAFEGR